MAASGHLPKNESDAIFTCAAATQPPGRSRAYLLSRTAHKLLEQYPEGAPGYGTTVPCLSYNVLSLYCFGDDLLHGSSLGAPDEGPRMVGSARKCSLDSIASTEGY